MNIQSLTKDAIAPNAAAALPMMEPCNSPFAITFSTYSSPCWTLPSASKSSSSCNRRLPVSWQAVKVHVRSQICLVIVQLSFTAPCFCVCRELWGSCKAANLAECGSCKIKRRMQQKQTCQKRPAFSKAAKMRLGNARSMPSNCCDLQCEGSSLMKALMRSSIGRSVILARECAACPNPAMYATVSRSCTAFDTDKTYMF